MSVRSAQIWDKDAFIKNYQISLSIFILLMLLTDLSIAGGKGMSRGTVAVRGYVRKDGTYVQPHQRTAPDGSIQNNWSTYGNYNPYTGEEGRVLTPPSGPVGSDSSSYRSSAYLPSLPPVAPSVERATLKSGSSLYPRSTLAIPSQPNVTPSQSNNVLPDNQHSRPFTLNSQPISRQSTYIEQQKQRDEERSQFWAKQGYSFNPAYMTAYSMDQKVKDIERAEFWRSKGYSFNPEYMTAYSMDQKVRNIERARYWKTLGLNFDPEYMTDYAMDREARRLGVSPR
ncbi:hypothetical protein [Undibacterium sp. WLHG33]|uniref:hypothetical protein n=1 Tax=Undibacterium sp. WLHG33 TaxID=3412482 RepID=UPI003C2BE73A